GAGLRHQQTRVGALIDLPEIKHRHAGKRPVRPLHYGAPPLYAPLRPSGGRGRGPARSAGRVRWAMLASARQSPTSPRPSPPPGAERESDGTEVSITIPCTGRAGASRPRRVPPPGNPR